MYHIWIIYYLIILQIEKALAIIDVQTIDFQEIQNQCWSKFYSFVQQCYQVSVKYLFNNATKWVCNIFVHVIRRSSIYKIFRKTVDKVFIFDAPWLFFLKKNLNWRQEIKNWVY